MEWKCEYKYGELYSKATVLFKLHIRDFNTSYEKEPDLTIPEVLYSIINSHDKYMAKI
ncbi:hypothetical protein Q5M85_10445 [Paraclostridium bifermentans]|nr:hypothetical protein [Paraclostridium bifermentans]